MTEDDLKIVRRAYAKQIMHAAHADDARLEDALAELKREDFLPPGPWQLLRFQGGYQQTPDDDPVYVYQDAPVALMPEKRLNNGQPSFLASLIASGRLRDGEHAIHIGTGTGYYTAVMARLAGRSGRVTGFELDPDLASRARDNLRPYPTITVVEGDGSAANLEPADVIYVNAGASHPAANWLDALAPGGRLILPLTVSIMDHGKPMTQGAIFLIERQAGHYSAHAISSAMIYPCTAGRDEIAEQALAAAFKKGGIEKVTRLHRTDDIPEDRCWLRAPGWSLTYE